MYHWVKGWAGGHMEGVRGDVEDLGSLLVGAVA